MTNVTTNTKKTLSNSFCGQLPKNHMPKYAHTILQRQLKYSNGFRFSLSWKLHTKHIPKTGVWKFNHQPQFPLIHQPSLCVYIAGWRNHVTVGWQNWRQAVQTMVWITHRATALQSDATQTSNLGLLLMQITTTLLVVMSHLLACKTVIGCQLNSQVSLTLWH